MTAETAPRSRRPIVPLSPRTCRVLRVLTFVWSAITVGGLILSSRVQLLDARPGGNAFEIQVRPVFMGLFLFGALLAWRWEIAGGTLAAFTAAGLATFAHGQLEASSAALVIVAFVVPGFFWVLLDLHDRRRTVALAAVLMVSASAATGGFVSARIYDSLYGPSHPSSATAALPDSALQWIWSGGVTGSSGTVTAKLRHADSTARLAVGRDDDLSDARYFGPVSSDGNGVVRLTADGLDAGVTYHYAVEVDGQLDRIRAGQFRTFVDGPDSFTVALGSCARVGSNGAVFDAIRALDPDLYLIDGDWHYANLTDDDPHEFREVMDETLTQPAQAALYRDTPIAYVWDDHDYGGNGADAGSTTRPAAMSVYRQYVPHYSLAGADAPIYQAFTVGRVRFILTDTRSARSPASAVDDANKTMLGEAQKAWFEQQLLEAKDRYPLIVWVNPDPWVGAASAGSDSWAGYSTERTELADFIAGHGITGLLMLSGDAHMVAIDDGTNTDYSTSHAGGFPLLHGGALDRPGHIKGGPYSEGAYGGGGQFGVLAVDDPGGDRINVRLAGQNWRGDTLLAYSFTVAAEPVAPHAP
jgi:hypothetical protein